MAEKKDKKNKRVQRGKTRAPQAKSDRGLGVSASDILRQAVLGAVGPGMAVGDILGRVGRAGREKLSSRRPKGINRAKGRGRIPREHMYAAPPRDPDPILPGAPPSKRDLERLRAKPESPLTAEESADLTAGSILDRQLERRILKPARAADIMKRRERRRQKVEDAYEPSYKRGGKVKKSYKKGGSVKAKSIDGIAQRGKTRGTMR